MKVSNIVEQADRYKELDGIAKEIESALEMIAASSRDVAAYPSYTYGVIQGYSLELTSYGRKINLSSAYFQRYGKAITKALEGQLAEIRAEMAALEV